MNSINAIESGIARLKWLAAATRFEIALLRHGRALKAGFNPDQPRVPGGGPGGGQWTADGGGQSPDAAATTDFSATRRPRLGSRPHGHHFVSHGVYSKLPLKPETRRVFDEEKTGPLIERHRNSKEHGIYNEAVREKLDTFLSRRGLTPNEMSPQDAREFAKQIKESRDPRIRDFNLKIYREQIMRLMRRAPRRLD